MDLMQLDTELIGNLERYAEQVEDKVARLQRLVWDIWYVNSFPNFSVPELFRS